MSHQLSQYFDVKGEASNERGHTEHNELFEYEIIG